MSIKRSNRGGSSPLSYIGVGPESTPAFFEVDRDPTIRDYNDYSLGDFWLNRKTNDVFILISLEKNLGTGVKEATWVYFVNGQQILRSFEADVGVAIPASGTINIYGFKGLETIGSGNTVTVRFNNSALDGQIFIGGGIAPTLGYITSTGGTLTITNGTNSITISSTPGGDLDTLGTDSGTAIPSGGIVTISGSTNINTSAAADVITVDLKNDISIVTGLTLSALTEGIMQTDGAGNVISTNGLDGQLMISATGAAPAWADVTSTGVTVAIAGGPNTLELEIAATGTLQRLGADTGPGATTATGTVNVLGGTNINTVGVGDTTTVNLDNSIALSGGLTISSLGAGVLTNSGAGLISATDGTAGQLLIGATGGVPAWADVTSSTLTLTPGSGTLSIDGGSSSASPCPPFLYHLIGMSGTGVLGGSSYFYFGVDNTLAKIFDDDDNFYPGDGAGAKAYFQAPVTGIYLLSMNVHFYTGVAGSINPDLWVAFETPTRSFYTGLNAPTILTANLQYSKKICALCNLTALDKVYFKVMANTGVPTWALGDIATHPKTCISGFLVEI